jgi:hypothetical protein
MKQGRLVGIDLGMAIAVLAYSALSISGAVGSWEPLAGTFENNLLEDVFLALLFYMFGFRSSFVIRTALPGPRRSFRYFLVRGTSILLLGAIHYWLNNDLILLGIGFCVIFSPVFAMLHSSFLYFFMFAAAIVSLIVSLNFIEDAEYLSHYHDNWKELLLFTRQDAIIPWSLFYFSGMIIGRKNFGEPKWFRYFTSSSIIFLVFAVSMNYFINSFFKGSYLIDFEQVSRLFPFKINVYRPSFFLLALPLCNLMLIGASLLSEKTTDRPFWGGIFRIGQFHLSYVLIAILVSAALNGINVESWWIAPTVAGIFVIIMVSIATLTKDLIHHGPLEWLIQRMY